MLEVHQVKTSQVEELGLIFATDKISPVRVNGFIYVVKDKTQPRGFLSQRNIEEAIKGNWLKYGNCETNENKDGAHVLYSIQQRKENRYMYDRGYFHLDTLSKKIFGTTDPEEVNLKAIPDSDYRGYERAVMLERGWRNEHDILVLHTLADKLRQVIETHLEDQNLLMVR